MEKVMLSKDQPKNKLSLELAQAIRQHVKKPGHGYASAAKLFGIPVEDIKPALKEHGLVIRRGGLGQTTLSDKQVKKAHQMLLDGDTQRDVCKIMGNCHVNTLKKALRLKGITIDPTWRGKKLTQKKLDKALRLFQNGLSRRMVASKLGMSSVHLSSQLRNAGVEKPQVDFQFTKEMLTDVCHWTAAGETKAEIADRLETTPTMVKLMLVWLGMRFYFITEDTRRKSFHGLTLEKVQRFIRYKFKGGSTPAILGELDTTRPTLNLLMARIESEFVREIIV